MLSANDVAKYFLRLDSNNSLFSANVITRNGRQFYDGNARLNKYLHLAQNLYIAKTGRPLMDAVFYAYDNGAVIPEIQERYMAIRSKKNEGDINISSDEKAFLDKVFLLLQNASVDDLIELSHEDAEWVDKQGHYYKEDERMDSMARAEEYKLQYADALTLMDRM